MGRFILTDKGAWDDMLHKNNEACGFRCNGYHKAEDVILRTYSKLNIDTFNYIQKGDGFAAVCGTLVYTNNTGREALELLARDLPVKNIHDIRRDCAGCFAVIYKQNDQITVFVDESAVYSVYYYHGQTFLVTNTYFHVEKCAKQPVSPAVVAEHILNGAILGNETPFKNIYRLSGSECVVYNCKTKKLYIEKVGTNTYTYQFQTYEQKISCLKGLVQKYTGYQKLFKGQHSVFGTGGVDSRLVLSANLDAGIRPGLISWYGVSEKMDNDEEDCRIWSDIARNNGLAYNSFDISEQNVYTMNQKSLYKYGEHAVHYGNNRKWYHFFEQDRSGFLDSGLFGERLKTWSLFGHKVTISGFVRDYIRKNGMEPEQIAFGSMREYEHNMQKKLVAVLRKEGILNDVADPDDLEVVAQDYWDCAHHYMADFMNVFTCSFPVFGQKEVSELIKYFNYDEKDGKKLSVRMIRELYPGLLDEPFFCTRMHMTADADSGMLKTEDGGTAYMAGLRGRFRNILLMHSAGKAVLNFYRRRRYADGILEQKQRWTDKINRLRITSQLSLKLNRNSMYHVEHYAAAFYRLIVTQVALEDGWMEFHK